MEIKNIIYRRKSFRSYSHTPLSQQVMEDIENAIKTAKPLYPNIRFEWQFLGAEDIKCIQNWRSPHYIAMFSEDVEGARENLGFIFQQVELYMQSKCIGTCWLGLGKLNSSEIVKAHKGMECLMMMSFGTPKDEEFRSDISQFNRRTMEEITDRADERLECARIAPSAVNSQPWYFLHSGEDIHVYCMTKYLIHKVLGKMNKFDIGIALAHIYEENKDTFQFFKTETPAELKGYYYIGSIKI